MKITLITYSQNNIDEEIMLFKKAMLYADNVELCSFTSSGIFPYLFLNNMTWRDKIDVLRNLIPFFEALGEKIDNNYKREIFALLEKMEIYHKSKGIQKHLKIV